MNIFYLDNNPKTCAEQHCDKHVVKMILEYAQLLSTAHRVLDGVPTDGFSSSGRRRTDYILPENIDGTIYRATHINHPSAVWVRQSVENYNYLHRLLHYTCKEYTRRYAKVHKIEREDILGALYISPENLPKGVFTPPPPAMPDYCKVVGDSVASYRNYYIKEKARFAKWKTKAPEWFVEGISNANL